jgi:hypothetical protein
VRGAAVDAYWLGHCEGFAVSDGQSHLGVVEHVAYRSRHDRPDALLVARGFLRLRRFEIPVELVREIDPRDQTVAVSRPD